MDTKVAALLPLLTVGLALNTIGIALESIGAWRFALMGAGLVLIFTCLVGLLRVHRDARSASSDRRTGDSHV